MATLTQWYPEVLPWVQGCPPQFVRAKVLSAIEELCRRTLYWQVEAAPIDIVAAQASYPLVSPTTDTLITEVVHAFDSGNRIISRSEDELDLNWPKFCAEGAFFDGGDILTPWRQVTSDNAYFFYLPDNQTNLRLVGIPTTTKIAGLTVRLALRPLPTATTMDDSLYNHLHEEISWGAIGRLLSIPDKPWSNGKLSVYYSELFEEAIEETKGRIVRSRTRDNRSVLHSRAFAR